VTPGPVRGCRSIDTEREFTVAGDGKRIGAASAATFFSRLIWQRTSQEIARKNTLASMYICAYTPIVVVEWDGRKAETNLRKHGVAFDDAASVLHDDYALTIIDDRVQEMRLVKIGADQRGRILVLVYTVRGATFRLISARRATAKERRLYREGA
jgi:uncharacterized protein